MKKQIAVAAAAVTAALAFAPGAFAAGPELTLERADRVVEREVRLFVEEWNITTDEEKSVKAEILADCAQYECDVEDLEFAQSPDWYLTGYELDPCERESRRVATCDVTYESNTGESCDEVIQIRTTRRNRIAVASLAFMCDGDQWDERL